eukprot:SAG11_NODE_9235_length_930_cov_3.419976_1_plen_52_part_10
MDKRVCVASEQAYRSSYLRVYPNLTGRCVIVYVHVIYGARAGAGGGGGGGGG